MFIRIANCYQRFIQGFSHIDTPLNSVLKTTGKFDSNPVLTEIGKVESDDSGGNKVNKSKFV